jgi:hypothetical protein
MLALLIKLMMTAKVTQDHYSLSDAELRPVCQTNTKFLPKVLLKAKLLASMTKQEISSGHKTSLKHKDTRYQTAHVAEW